MTLTIEKKLRDFHFWGGAARHAAKLTQEELDWVETMMEESMGDDGYWSTTEVNDMMWFQFEDICDWLNLDYEEVMTRE